MKQFVNAQLVNPKCFCALFTIGAWGFLTVSLRDGVGRCDVPTELQVAKGRKIKSRNKVWVIQLFGKRPKGSSLQSPLLTAVASTLVGSC